MKNAYAFTSACNDSKELFNNLKYRVDMTGKVNWNSIKFEYKIDEPLNQVNLKYKCRDNNHGNYTKGTV